MKLSILTTFAGFTGFRRIIQLLAAYSISLIKDAEVIVLGNDMGVEKICRIYGFDYIINNVKTGKDIGIDTNAILLSDAFEKAKTFISGDIILYTNGDNILIPNEFFIDLLNIVYDYSDGDFCGFEYPYFLKSYIGFISPNKLISENFKHVKKVYKKYEELKSTNGISFFAWTRNNFEKLQIPKFVVSGWRWDIWLGNNLYSLSKKIYLLSNIINAVHLDHPRADNEGNSISSKHNRKLIRISMGNEMEDMSIYEVPPEFDFSKALPKIEREKQ